MASRDRAILVKPRTRRSRTFAELLIDCEEDRALRPVLVGVLRGRTEPASRSLVEEVQRGWVQESLRRLRPPILTSWSER